MSEKLLFLRREWELAVWSSQSEIKSKWILPDVCHVHVSRKEKPFGDEILHCMR